MAAAHPAASVAWAALAEQALVDEPLALFCFHLALGGWTVERIEADYAIDQTQLIPALLKLERIGLIRLLPGNVIQLMTARSIGWRRGGPMRRFFDRRVKEEFLQNDFSTPGSIWEFEIGELSDASRALLERRLASLFREVRDLVARDALGHWRGRGADGPGGRAAAVPADPGHQQPPGL